MNDIDYIRLEELLEHIRLCACSPVATPMPHGLSSRECSRDRGWNESSGKKQWLNVLVRCSGPLDEPRLDLREPLDITNSLRDVPYLVRINHKHIPHWPHVLSFDAARARGVPSLRQVSGVTNDGTDGFPAVEVRLNVGADLHLEVVDALMKRFER